MAACEKHATWIWYNCVSAHVDRKMCVGRQPQWQDGMQIMNRFITFFSLSFCCVYFFFLCGWEKWFESWTLLMPVINFKPFNPPIRVVFSWKFVYSSFWMWIDLKSSTLPSSSSQFRKSTRINLIIGPENMCMGKIHEMLYTRANRPVEWMMDTFFFFLFRLVILLCQRFSLYHSTKRMDQLNEMRNTNDK